MSMNLLFNGANDRNVQEGCINMYDVRLRDTYPSCGMAWPPDLALVTPYLRVIPFVYSILCLATRCREGAKH